MSRNDSNLRIDSFNIHRLIIAGVTVGSKYFSDVFFTNSRYAKVKISSYHLCITQSSSALELLSFLLESHQATDFWSSRLFTSIMWRQKGWLDWEEWGDLFSGLTLFPFVGWRSSSRWIKYPRAGVSTPQQLQFICIDRRIATIWRPTFKSLSSWGWDETTSESWAIGYDKNSSNDITINHQRSSARFEFSEWIPEQAVIKGKGQYHLQRFWSQTAYDIQQHRHLTKMGKWAIPQLHEECRYTSSAW